MRPRWPNLFDTTLQLMGQVPKQVRLSPDTGDDHPGSLVKQRAYAIRQGPLLRSLELVEVLNDEHSIPEPKPSSELLSNPARVANSQAKGLPFSSTRSS